MRNTLVAVAFLLTASAALAQDNRTQISISANNITYTESSIAGTQFSGGGGLAISHAWSSRWSTEAAISAERYRAYYTTVMPVSGGVVAPVTEHRVFNVFPVDFLAQYRFTNSSRWTPYIAAGARYVNAPSGLAYSLPPDGGLIPLRPGLPLADRTSGQIGIGSTLRITPSFGLRFDAMRLLRSDDVAYDKLFRASIGVTWKF